LPIADGRVFSFSIGSNPSTHCHKPIGFCQKRYVIMKKTHLATQIQIVLSKEGEARAKAN
jgi:hypothetical protein